MSAQASFASNCPDRAMKGPAMMSGASSFFILSSSASTFAQEFARNVKMQRGIKYKIIYLKNSLNNFVHFCFFILYRWKKNQNGVKNLYDRPNLRTEQADPALFQTICTSSHVLIRAAALLAAFYLGFSQLLTGAGRQHVAFF